MSVHRCRECGKTPQETRFRLNGSGFYRVTCNACETEARRLRKGNQPEAAAAPEPAPSYAVMPYNGAQIAWDTDGGMVCLTDLWRAAGSPANKEPAQWLRTDRAQEYIEIHRRHTGNMFGDHITQSRRGNTAAGAGTWAPKIIGLAYARYLSAALDYACDQFITDQWGEARAVLPPQPAIQRLADELTAIKQAIALLPGLDGRTRAILGGVESIKGDISGATLIKTQEVWKGQIYIGLLTHEALLTLARREYTNIPPGAEIVFIGRTAPSGSVHDLRIEDYAGKFSVRPDDYELLATFGTDDPKTAENLLLHNPMRGCKRLRSVKGASKTFIAATGGAERQYTALTARHYTCAALQLAVTGIGGQIGMFEEAA